MDAFLPKINVPGYPGVPPRIGGAYGRLIPPTPNVGYGASFAPISISQPNVAPEVFVAQFRASSNGETKRLAAIKGGTVVCINTRDADADFEEYPAKNITKVDNDYNFRCLDDVFITVLLGDWTVADHGQYTVFSGSFVVEGACNVRLPLHVGDNYSQGGCFRVSAEAKNDTTPMPRAYLENISRDNPAPDQGDWPTNRIRRGLGGVNARSRRGRGVNPRFPGQIDNLEWNTSFPEWGIEKGDPMEPFWALGGTPRKPGDNLCALKAGLAWPRTFRTFTLLTEPMHHGDHYTARCDLGMHTNYALYDGQHVDEVVAIAFRSPPLQPEAVERFPPSDAENARVANGDIMRANVNWHEDKVPW